MSDLFIIRGELPGNSGSHSDLREKTGKPDRGEFPLLPLIFEKEGTQKG